MVAWIHQQADSHMLGAFVQMWCHPSKNMKITSQKQPKSIKHRRKGDCWSVLPAVPSLHSFPNWTRSSGRCGESPLPLTRPDVPLKKGPKIPISTAAHLIHDLSGLGKCPFLGLYFTLEKPMKGGLISVTNSYDLRKISSNQQISTDIPSNINRYQQINLDISGYFFTSPGNFSWFPPAARVVWGWPPKRFVRGFRWSPVASCAPVRFFFRPWHFFQRSEKGVTHQIEPFFRNSCWLLLIGENIWTEVSGGYTVYHLVDCLICPFLSKWRDIIDISYF